MDTVFIHGLRVDAQIGIYRRERTTTQPVEIDLDIAIPNSKVFTSGKVGDTIDYAVVVDRVVKELAETRFGLVEEMAEAIASMLLKDFKSPRVRIRIAKLGILRNASRVGISIERTATAGDATRTGHWQSKEWPSGSNPFADSDTSP
jgi:7,8-dihydroneopterin aldolase/epimerase/oxygenase